MVDYTFGSLILRIRKPLEECFVSNWNRRANFKKTSQKYFATRIPSYNKFQAEFDGTTSFDEKSLQRGEKRVQDPFRGIHQPLEKPSSYLLKNDFFLLWFFSKLAKKWGVLVWNETNAILKSFKSSSRPRRKFNEESTGDIRIFNKKIHRLVLKAWNFIL